MFATIRAARSTKTSIIASVVVAVAVLVGQLQFLDRQVSTPYARAMDTLTRPHLTEEITVRAPVTVHFTDVR